MLRTSRNDVDLHQRIVLHFCLAGPDLTGEHALIEHLRKRHVVTLVAKSQWLDQPSLIEGSDALVLEAGARGEVDADSGWRAQLRTIHMRAPMLPIILVDGDLTNEEKADAFRLGALDFFPAPCHADLLAERLVVLALAARRVETPAVLPTA